MRQFLSVAIVICLMACGASAQSKLSNTARLSPRTQQYLLEAKTAGGKGTPMPDYVYKRTADNIYMSALIKVSSAAVAQAAMDALGVRIGTRAGSIWTALIPINNVPAFTKIPGISYIELDEPLSIRLDSARRTTRADSVQQGIGLPMGYAGKNVVLGIVDVGFDYTHPTFYDTTGSHYRVKRVWEEKTIGTPPAGFAYGNEITDTNAMQAAQTDNSANTHGMHVAGIAGGSGYGSDSSNSKYRGMAYESDIVLVGIMPDSVQWQNTGMSDFIDGMNYIYTYAASVGEPAVINLSWGSPVGPHDGSSLFSQACDALTGPGRIFVCAAGNEGNENIHLQKAFTNTDTVVNTFVNFDPAATSNNTWVDIWGDTAKNFCIQVSLYKDTQVAATGYVCLDDTIHQFALVGLSHDTCYVTITTSTAEFNDKPRIYLSLYSKTRDSICLSIKGAGGRVNAWNGYVSQGEGYFGVLTDNGRAWATAGDSAYTTTDMVSTASAISAGAYSAKIDYTSIQHIQYTFASYTNLGQVVPFSSIGPTEDGRVKPDITAPGLCVVSSFSSYDHDYLPGGVYYSNAVSSFVSPNNGQTYYYGQLSGTSMATPCTSGIIALLLQANPALSPSSIRNILAQTAILDSFTGVLPGAGTNIWGHGKINAYSALKAAALTAGIGPMPGGNLDCRLYPNPNAGKFSIEYTSDRQQVLAIEIYDINGATVYTDNWNVNADDNIKQLDLSKLSSGIYLAKVSSPQGSTMIKVSVER
jgi:minor extracellular serine protease Vpr